MVHAEASIRESCKDMFTLVTNIAKQPYSLSIVLRHFCSLWLTIFVPNRALFRYRAVLR